MQSRHPAVFEAKVGSKNQTKVCGIHPLGSKRPLLKRRCIVSANIHEVNIDTIVSRLGSKPKIGHPILNSLEFFESGFEEKI